MKRWRTIGIALTTVAVVAIVAWVLRAKLAVDAWTGQVATGPLSDARGDVAYPPEFPHASIGAVAAPAQEQVELCGFGKVTAMQMPAGLQQEADATVMRLIEQFERKTGREQAMGLSLRAMLAVEQATAPITEGDPLKCMTTPACAKRVEQAEQRAAAPTAEQLARLATTNRDPYVYAAAVRACRPFVTGTSAPSCAGVRPEQLAQLDPDNGANWLLVASDAAERKDTAALESALLRTARSRRIDSLALPYGDLLASIDVHYEPVRTLVLMRLAGAFFGQSPAAYATAASYCPKEMQGVPGRRELCLELADVLAERAPDLLGVTNGVAIGARAGWPADKLARHEEQRKTLMAEMNRVAGAPGFSCEWAAGLETWMGGVFKHGEAGYLRQLTAKRLAR